MGSSELDSILGEMRDADAKLIFTTKDWGETINGKEAIKAEAKQAIKDLFLEVVGEEATPKNKETIVSGWIMSHENQIGYNLLREKIHQKVEEL